MNVYVERFEGLGGVEVQLHAFLTLVQGEGEWTV
jgi:hypothetical protein